MTFNEWVESAGFTYLAPRMKAEFKECWTAGQEAMRERAAASQCYPCQQGKPIDHVDLGIAFHLDPKGCPTYCTGQDIRALPVE